MGDEFAGCDAREFDAGEFDVRTEGGVSEIGSATEVVFF